MAGVLISPFPKPVPVSQPDALGDPGFMIATAVGQLSATNSYVMQLASLAGGLQPPTITPVFPTGPSAPAVSLSTPPTMDTVVWAAPNMPDYFTGTLDISAYTVTPFDDDPPELLFGTAPAAFSEAAPDAPAVDLSFEMPELTLSLPAPPSLLSISVTPFDGITMPTMDVTIPELTVVAPSIREYTPGSQYSSALLTAVATGLQARIAGGTGIDPGVEGAIWDRGREREARSAADAVRNLDQMESLGFAFPPGVYLDARLKLATETDYANRGHSREVMIKRAELELASVQQALTTATTLEQANMSYANQVEQRVFDSCKYATEAGVAIYNAQVQGYAAYVEAYSKKIAIYQALIQGEIAKVEAYKAQLSAETAKAEINKALVDQYRVQSDVALSNVEVFKARIGAIQARAEIEKTKVAVFGEQVKGYAAKINAYTAGVEGYRAQVQAEGTKQEAYRSRVQAFSATVDATVKQIEARIRAFEGTISASNAAWEGYKAATQGEASKAQAIAAVNSSRADSYKAEVTGIAAYNETLTKQWQVSLDQAQRVSEIGINAAKANAELYVTTRSLATDAAKVGAQVNAQLGAAALGALNWSNSFSQSDSTSDSTVNSVSNSFTDSFAQSTSVSYNHNFSE